jgi:hypothetical protein
VQPPNPDGNNDYATGNQETIQISANVKRRQPPLLRLPSRAFAHGVVAQESFPVQLPENVEFGGRASRVSAVLLLRLAQ